MIEYETASRDYYTNGVDVHGGRNWTIRHNLFRNFRAPQRPLAGPSILMWNGSSGTIAAGNTFIDCQREVAFGLIDRPPDDHSGPTSGTYSSPIEYRFPQPSGVQIANTLLDGVILARDGATATLSGNVTSASAAMFVNPSAAGQALTFRPKRALQKQRRARRTRRD